MFRQFSESVLEEFSVQFEQLLKLYREMKVFHLIGIFSAFNFLLEAGDINIKNKNTHIASDVKPNVLFRSAKNLVNNIGKLTSISLLG